MSSRQLLVCLAVVMVVVAGCSGSTVSAPSPIHEPSDTTTAATAPTAASATAAASPSAPPLALWSPSSIAVDTADILYWADCEAARVVRFSAPDDPTAVAGSGPGGSAAGYSGDGGPAIAAQVACPHALALDVAGNLYIATGNHAMADVNSRVRLVDSTGTITTFAGGGTSLTGGLATDAYLAESTGIAFDHAGDLYLSTYDNKIQRVDTSGVISTIAGNGTAGFSGDGGSAADAILSGPSGLAFDTAGNLYFADSNNNRIRKIDLDGRISTVVGTGPTDSTGDGAAGSAATLAGPRGMAIDRDGNLYIAEADGNRVRRVDTNGVITTLAGTGEAGYEGDGGPATVATLRTAGFLAALAIDSHGNLFIADAGNRCVRVVSPDGTIRTAFAAG